MSMMRLWTIFKARNYEFFRDRAAFGYNFLFPFLIVAGFGIIFGGKNYTEYKIGLFPQEQVTIAADNSNIPSGLRKKRFLKFNGFATMEEGLATLKHHKIDLLIKVGVSPYEYYISEASPKGCVLENKYSKPV